MDVAILALAFVVILMGAELFTNGIEWVGRKLELAEGAVGSVLAAVGTALPETMIPIIAILFASGASSHEVGVGAILGAPFMLATLAMFVTGIAVLWAGRRRQTGDRMLVDTGVLAHDMRYFAIAYAIAIGAAFLPVDPVWLKWIVAVVLIGIYGWYVRGHLREEATNTGGELAPLRFHRLDRGAHREDPHTPRLRIVNAQVITALGLIVVGAAFFVGAVSDLSTHLAMGNITGAMVFQSTIPTVVALVFASDTWVAAEGSYLVFASAGIAFLSSAIIFIPMARRGVLHGRLLLVGGAFYAAYVGLVIGVTSGLIGGGSGGH